MSFHMNILDQQIGADGSTTVAYQVYKKNKTPMTASEITALSAKLLKNAPAGADFNMRGHADELPKDAPVTMRGLNKARWQTFKKFGSDEINIQDVDDYYDGQVAHNGNFKQFYQAMIIIKIPALNPIKKK